MAKKSPPPPTRPEPPRLTESTATARGKLEERVAAGQEIVNRNLSTAQELQKLSVDERAWTDYGNDLLRALFTTDQLMHEFMQAGQSMAAYFRPPTPSEEVRRVKESVSKRVSKLQSIIERLALYENRDVASLPPVTPADDRDLTHAFVVHGHDHGAKDAVARFLTSLGIDPIILQEKASSGRTLIEKLEHYGKVSFAVVLLTPDDEGRLAGGAEALKPRARQNVLLELGYFVGLLGRDRVCALCKPPAEVPSDWDGVVWVPMDEHEGWKMKLAKELRAAGFAVDMNALL